MNGPNIQEKILSNEPWYHGLLPREDMKVLLKRNGDFLVRFTDPKIGEPRKFVLSLLLGSGEDSIRHYIFLENNERFALEDKWFSSIAQLLNYYHRTKEPVSSKNPDTVLVRPIGREPWEKLHSDVKLIQVLGEGAFGEVHMGEIKIGKDVRKAAIKLAKLESLTKEQIKEIMHEARLMRKFNHRNVVTFYGVAAGQEPLMVIMELADKGALDSYLKKNAENLTVVNKSEMICQAARGLDYLHSLNVIHRDIAARNCLYGNGQVKISDFGLSREGSSYRMNPHKKIPIRWLAPEVPRSGCYTPKSDVFAYGIMCWEVYHNGQEPYTGMRVAEVLPKVQEGYRMPFKSEVPEVVADYITNKVCAGDDFDRCSMGEVVLILPGLAGIPSGQTEEESYFKPPKPESSVTSEIKYILPEMSHPIPVSELNREKTEQQPSNGVSCLYGSIMKRKQMGKTRGIKSRDNVHSVLFPGGIRRKKKNGAKKKSSSASVELPTRKSFMQTVTKGQTRRRSSSTSQM